MNYRHAFHAGNFADVVKHAVLARIVAHLREKDSAFRIIDTHAGSGLTRLTGREASQTGEWRQGIGRLLAAPLGPEIRGLLAPYLQAIAQYNAGGRLLAYPGSPLLALSWLRPQDRLIACELVPAAAAALARSLGKDRRAKVITIDGSPGQIFDRQRTFAGQSAVATRNRAAKPASRARRGAPPRPPGHRTARLARRGKMR